MELPDTVPHKYNTTSTGLLPIPDYEDTPHLVVVASPYAWSTPRVPRKIFGGFFFSGPSFKSFSNLNFQIEVKLVLPSNSALSSLPETNTEQGKRNRRRHGDAVLWSLLLCLQLVLARRETKLTRRIHRKRAAQKIR